MFSFDTKFWRTLIPLLTNPGKVSKEYREGKRSRYSNPFRFYITASIIFFLVLGFSKNYNKYQNLTKEDIQKELNTKDGLPNNEIAPDSIKKLVAEELDKSTNVSLPDKKKKKFIDTLKEEAKDTAEIKNSSEQTFSFEGTRLGAFLKYQKEHPKAATNEALDSLKYPKNFKNRFLYERSKVMGQIFNNEDNEDKFLSEVLSYGSISLFIFLPLFTLFLRLFYIRRKYTYVDHLIFVFHTQTVFFMLLTIFTIVDLFVATEDLWVFSILFLVYLFLAMKKFYQQGILKTAVKFLLLNLVYVLMAIVGVFLVTFVSFALY
ncbi:DUF3667 domain-containing protein [Polaribacter sp. IC073]|uniref:DUF3667 domain-containing protein n=1 Tax=Polaribacter sp. IC073 TaxID=2508540 RepID=UPI00167A5FAF|nr:DUF3667 domain-containing protein [Polaribacter sp. IC073]